MRLKPSKGKKKGVKEKVFEQLSIKGSAGRGVQAGKNLGPAHGRRMIRKSPGGISLRTGLPHKVRNRPRRREKSVVGARTAGRPSQNVSWAPYAPDERSNDLRRQNLGQQQKHKRGL